MEQKAFFSFFLCCHVIVRTSLKTREDCSRSYKGRKRHRVIGRGHATKRKMVTTTNDVPYILLRKIKESRTGFHRPFFRRSSRVVENYCKRKKYIAIREAEKILRLENWPIGKKPGCFCGRPNNCGILGNTTSSQKAWPTSPTTTPPPLLPTPYLSRPFAPDTATAAALGQGRPVALVPWATPPPSSLVQIP